MSISVDILHLFPDLAAIEKAKLQVYCNEWLRRPVARDRGVAQIIVDDQRNLLVTLDDVCTAFDGDHVFIPIDELLGYIVERHFTDADQQQGLHFQIRYTRMRWDLVKFK
jgi:hypothetical protein